ncbi:MAG TPA: low molecular weight phosphotyrosine protein phosphatase [Chromatiaceae bacterium]|nr:low molecular weight phosphotyrosine protein phosphatase [Chromatiaceae bacterium]HIA08105.1 low molecular weight phosphotyrosine protein phosphatase [Chromatiaceae bacterium]HIB83738.1 low molecular weight phosphotyrosine protein phosphatase [Chromatiaceae bacterium]HIO13958.1 low molecular weight phosphotyrosine protein phosphatase [Chromatiales bacterium]HIO54219.1 low molecular weight phosphotyrosine protein phosphatase [Chromatiales bacterium]
MINVLFVCMGNICRSPTGEAVFKHLLEEAGMHWEVHVDSAGTIAIHAGASPDSRAAQAARARGIDMGNQTSRMIEARDFVDFDYILAMDNDNYCDLMGRCPPEYQDKVHMMLEYAQSQDFSEVPDPYYGGGKGFTVVLDLIEDASRGLIADIRSRYADKLG